MNYTLRRSTQNPKNQTMKCLVFFNTLFLLVCIPAFSQRQYSTYQKDGYVGLEFVETHTKITLPVYEEITPCFNVQGASKNSYINQGVYRTNEKIFYRNFTYNTEYFANDFEFWKVVKDGKYGIISKDGKSIVSERYDDIIYLIDTSFVVISHDHKMGVVHKNGTVLVAPTYDRILCSESLNGHFFLKAYSGNSFSVINETGTILSTFAAPHDASIKENHVILTDKNSFLKGASNLYGQEILPKVYDDLDIAYGVFSFKKDGEAGLMDLTGKPIFSRPGNDIFHIRADRSMIDVAHHAYQFVDNTGTALCTDTFSTISVHTNFMIVKMKSTGKWGVLNFDGKMIIPATYQSLSVWNEMLVANKEEKYGIINTSGNILLPFKYQNTIISSTNIPYLLVKQKGKYGCIDKQLHEVMPCKYEKLEYIYYANGNSGSLEDLRIVSQEGTLRGVIDVHGKIKLQYQETNFLGKKNEKYERGFLTHQQVRSDYFYIKKITDPVDKGIDCIVLDKEMRELLRCSSRSLFVYDEYFILAYVNRKYGMLAADGVTVIPFIYDQLYPVGNEYFIAKKDQYFGVLSRSGNTRVPFQYSHLTYFSDESIIAYDTNSNIKCGMIDYTGKIQIPFLYNYLYCDKRFNTNLLTAKKDSLFGLIDQNAKEIIPFEYAYIQQLDKTLFLVKKDGKHGIVNTDNKTILPIVYDDVFYIYTNENTFHVKNNNKHGVVGTDNKIIIPIIYDDLLDINKNMFQVKNNGLYGVLNNENQIIIPVEYAEISYDNISMHSNDQIFQVKKGDKIGIIDINGTTILPVEFSSIDCYDTICRISKDSMYYFAHGSTVNYKEAYEEIYNMGNMFRIKKNGKYGATNYKGDVLIEPVYDEVDFFSSKGFVVKKNGQEATFDIYGKMIIPLH